MPNIVNIAGYRFAPLGELRTLRARLLGLCKGWDLKGTILLSGEGINLFVAGVPDRIERLLLELRSIPGLESLEVKISGSDHQPFNRMLVRIKREIIAFGVPGIDPSRGTSSKLPAKTLKAWLDEGRPVVLLDTRNDYEVKMGTFRGAVPAGIDHFREFPEAVRRLPESMKERTVVMFCTGGIRCEKAGPFMEREGFHNIFQLEGGILKYFEECGAAHYDGECFVFDQRVGVDPALQETKSSQCFVCQSPLTEEEQRDGRHVPGRSCPYCFKTGEEQMALALARRHEAIRRAVDPLPGSRPYESFRPITVPDECNQFELAEFLHHVVRHIPRADWETDCARGLLMNREHVPVGAAHRVRSGERYLYKLADTVEPDVSGEIEILHEDEALIVLNKPAPLPMHPGGRYNRNTLQHIIELVYHPQKPHPAHRLDANTTGVVLMTRTRHFASRLQPQFARGEVEKVYLVRIHGRPERETFVCDLPISTVAGAVGTRCVDLEHGQPARTEFRVMDRGGDVTTLLEARPLTGRTNQIRVHLWEMGLPVCGDPVYLRGIRLGETQTVRVGDPPLMLHAWRIRFANPLDGRPVEFEAPAPAWAAAF